MLNKFTKILICILVAITSLFSIPQINHEVVQDVYATGCSLNEPESCKEEILAYLLALVGIVGLSSRGDLADYISDFATYKEANGQDLLTSYDIQSAANNQLMISSQGLVNFFNDLFDFNKEKDIPFEEGNLNYVNGANAGFSLYGLQKVDIKVTSYNAINVNLNHNVTGFNIPGNSYVWFTGSLVGSCNPSSPSMADYSGFSISKEPYITNGGKLYPKVTNMGNQVYDIQIHINYILSWVPLAEDVTLAGQVYKKGTEVLYQKTENIVGSTNLSNEYIVFQFNGKSRFYTKEYADSLPLQGNVGYLDLPKSPLDFINGLHDVTSGFIFKGFDLMQKNYKDFLEQIPLIKNGTFVEDIPLPTVQPTAVPTTIPYPTSIPFPTSVPNDWAESVPLPPLELPNVGEGTGSLTGNQAGALAGATWGWLGNALNSLMGTIGNMLKAILNAILSLPSLLINGLADLFKWIGGILAQILEAIIAIPGILVNAFQGVIDFCTTWWDKFLAFMSWLFNPADAKVKPLFDNLFNEKFNWFNQFVTLLQPLNVAGEPLELYIDFMGKKQLVATTKWFIGHEVMIRNGFALFMNFGLILALYKLLTSMFNISQSKGKGEE